MSGDNANDDSVAELDHPHHRAVDLDASAETGLVDATRRKFMVAGTASWVSVSLTGCLGILEDEEDEEDPIPTFVVSDEIIVGSDGIPEGLESLIRPGGAHRTFLPGMQVVFKVGIWDAETNAIVSDRALDYVRVELDRGESIDLSFYRDDREWSGDWTIPDDAEPGRVTYTVEVTNAARFTDLGVLEREFEIVEFEVPEAAVASYVVTIDTYSTETAAGGWLQSCLPQHNFTPGMKVGFTVGIFNGVTGDAVGDEDVEEVVVEFETGDLLELDWDDDNEVWRNTWEIPDDYEPGALTFEVQVATDVEVHTVGHRSRHGLSQDSIQVIDPDSEDDDDVDNED